MLWASECLLQHVPTNCDVIMSDPSGVQVMLSRQCRPCVGKSPALSGLTRESGGFRFTLILS